MILTFPVLNTRRPAGGAVAIYEFANGMRRRGHRVHLVHYSVGAQPLGTLDDLGWFEDFEQGIEHQFERFGDAHLPDADFIFDFDDGWSPRHGLPLTVIQGYGTFPRRVEKDMFLSPCPKICTSRWLIEVARACGVPDQQLVRVPLGLRLSKYGVTTPTDERGPRVAMRYESMRVKGAAVGMRVLTRAQRRVNELRAALFGTGATTHHQLQPWMTYLESPSQTVLVGDIYNKSSIFLCSSTREGFGLASIEAMACGCALVTTANGGSDEFAFHEETAMVAQPGDVPTLVAHVERLLRDVELRARVARQGRDFVRRFDWDRSAALIENFLHEYAAEPAKYCDLLQVRSVELS